MPFILDAIDAIVYFDAAAGNSGVGNPQSQKNSQRFPGGKLAEQISNCHLYKTRLERVYEKKFEFPETQDGSICLRSINRAKRSGAEGP